MTLTVIAGEPETGILGLATMTCLVGVGDVVPAGRPNVGLIACQAYIRPSARPLILDAMEEGHSLADSVDAVLREDESAAKRQILGIDTAYRPYAITGNEVDPICGALLGEHHVIAGNLLAHLSVLHATEMALIEGHRLPMAERLIYALRAGEQAGGDSRGRMSAAIYVMQPRQRALSLRIDFAKDPLGSLCNALTERLSPKLNDAFNR